MSKSIFDKIDAKKASLVIRSVDHKLRQQIIEFIETTGGNGPTVTQIYTSLKLEQSVASQHLKIMRDQGVVKEARNGKFFNYTVNKERAAAINTAIEILVGKAK